MTKDFHDIFYKAHQVKLSPAEKESMRVGIGLFARKHPVRNTDTVRLLLQEKSKSYISAFVEMFTLQPFINKLQPMAIALIIALLVGGGTSFAAEGALPGDILYPVKVGINEEARSFISFSNEAKIRWDARRAERRLEEAEQLAAEGRLNAETSADIKSRFESHASAFEDRAQKAKTKQDTQTSLEIQSDFEAALTTHERVLADMSAEQDNIRGDVSPLLLEVRAKLNSTVKARGDAEASVSADVNVGLKAAAEGKLRAAENKINEVRDFIVRAKSSVSANAGAQAEARLKIAEGVIARGKTETEAQSYGKAFASFQEAIRIAQEAKLLVATQERIKFEIKLPSIGVGVEGGTRDQLEQGTSSEASTEVEEKGKLQIDFGL